MINAERKLELLLDEGSRTLCSNKLPEKLPEWFDNKKFRRGQKVFHENIFVLLFAKYLGLIFGMCVKNLLNILIFTNNSDTPKKAYKRYSSTIMHACIWYDYDLNYESKFCKSLQNIASMHNKASTMSKSAGLGAITQRDMAVTQFAFFGLATIFPKSLGLKHVTEDDFDCIMHVWRIIGFMLGIQDRFNLYSGTVSENVEFSRVILEKHLKPLFYEIDENFVKMSRSAVRGLQSFNPFIEYEATVLYLCKLCDIKHLEHKNIYLKIVKTKQTDKMLKTLLLIKKIYPHFIYRILLNSYARVLIWMLKNFPILGYVKFGYDFKLLKQLKIYLKTTVIILFTYFICCMLAVYF